MKQFTIKRNVLVEEQVDFNMFIAYKVRENRKRVGMSQADLAKKLGLSRASVVNIEMGRQHMTIENLYFLCKFFGLKSNKFLPF